MDSFFAESMKAHVLITRISASSGCDVISIPRCNTLPSMISASTRFLAQPRLIIPTFGLQPRPVVVIVFILALEKIQRSTLNAQRPIVCLSRFDVGRRTFGVFLVPPRLPLIHCQVLIAFFQRMAVFRNLNGVRIENSNRDMLAVKFNRAISRRHPTFERGLAVLIAYGDSHVRSFKRVDSDL